MILALAAALAAPDDVVWHGIDYSLVRLVGTADFREPEAIVPSVFHEWNAQFQRDLTGILAARTGRSIRSSVGHLKALHDGVAGSRLVIRDDSIRVDQPYRTAEVVASHVRSTVPAGEPGLGLLFVADQLNKPQRAGCYWVTYFDTSSLDVLSTTYRCGEIGGIGFRSAWFGTVKSMLLSLTPAGVPGAQPPADQVTVRMDRGGLAVLDEAGVAYERLDGPPAPAMPVPVPVPEPEPVVIVADRLEPARVSALPATSSRSEPPSPEPSTRGAVRTQGPATWPDPTCPSVAGKTVCGFNCAETELDVACAQHPDERCYLESERIVCTDARRKRYRPTAEEGG